MDYFEYIPIETDDQTIACHPLIDACDACMLYRLLEMIGLPCDGKKVLDLGAGTGQVTRLLRGIPGIAAEACDTDPRSREFYSQHPELCKTRFHLLPSDEFPLPQGFDAVMCRGVYHHIPKSKRPRFLKMAINSGSRLILGDEGILEYSSLTERHANCDTWYNYVVQESRRRGLHRLADIETAFWEHEKLDTADDRLDFKESPRHLEEDVTVASLRLVSLDRIGDWNSLKGGFFVAVIAS